jgi:16S rRNA A1518/A1519 N6-dimethyltransferase RsmA/KsgA/DIM1 with predicted DNA glycosylase/AP lyase activity
MKINFIPYFTTSRYKVMTMVELTQPAGNEKMADLGSGDGRIAIAFAKKGVTVDAYELDKKLISELEKNAVENNVSEKIKVLGSDFWEAELSAYNIVAIYPMPDIMSLLEQKLQKELKPGAKVLLNYYPFSNWKYKSMKDKVYLYEK